MASLRSMSDGGTCAMCPRSRHAAPYFHSKRDTAALPYPAMSHTQQRHGCPAPALSSFIHADSVPHPLHAGGDPSQCPGLRSRAPADKSLEVYQQVALAPSHDNEIQNEIKVLRTHIDRLEALVQSQSAQMGLFQSKNDSVQADAQALETPLSRFVGYALALFTLCLLLSVFLPVAIIVKSMATVLLYGGEVSL